MSFSDILQFMVKYTVLKSINVPKECFLTEVLFWRAFGRFPEELWALDGPLRTSPTEREGDIQSVLGEMDGFSKEECQFAGLPNDPRMVWLLEGRSTIFPDHYRTLIEYAQESEMLVKLKHELKESIKFRAEVDDWLLIYDEYIDEFQNEICLDLRRGKLTAYITKIPETNGTKYTNFWDENPTQYKLDDFEMEPISSGYWTSKNIDWSESTLNTRGKIYSWILINVDELLGLYPPQVVVKPNQALPLGSNIAVVSSAVVGIQQSGSRRGRPSLPWSKFHVQVARMYREGEMPEKKEAAIAVLMDWFQSTIGKPASRSAIGEKLKPYFDELGSKDRK